MKNRPHHLIRLFLYLQKRLQRRATIKSARRLASWSERLYSVPKDLVWEKNVGDKGTYEWLTPPQVGSDRVILYLHGGFVFPLYNPTRFLASYLARKAGMRALLVDFRPAPEHPFPAALEDCLEAYRWLISEAGFFPEQVIFIGESAGANLAIATMLSARDAGDSLPRGAALMSPVVDFEGRGTFYSQDDPMADSYFVMTQLDAYRGEADPRHPLISPIHADLEGLPPMLIQVGSKEILRSGAEELALRATKAGVSTRLEIWPGMWHYWQVLVSFLPDAQDALQHIVQFMHDSTNISDHISLGGLQ
jgi:acetyl esterase/lipase